MALSSTSCPSCNTPNRAGSAFCNNCGSSLTGGGSPSGPTGRLASGQVLKQRYRIIQIVGQGGMGAVYKAEDTELGKRPVAIKEMSQSGLSQQEVKEAADAFKQEAIILAGLQHPNLPSIIDHFEENGRWYLVMSFIQGETLADYLNKTKEGKIPLDEALQIGIQLSAVLDYLHNQQPSIIFRDLKPNNIMRTPGGHIYLIDFGIARHFKPGQAKDTAYFGSMGYAPPEQYGKAQTTPRSDIYSLGVVLYQLLSGHDPSSSPFHFPLLQSLVPTVPTNLATLITQMLELDEDKRLANMADVKQKLEQIADQRRHPPVPPPTQAATPAQGSIPQSPLYKQTPPPPPHVFGQGNPSSSAPTQYAASGPATPPAPLPQAPQKKKSGLIILLSMLVVVVLVLGGSIITAVSGRGLSPGPNGAPPNAANGTITTEIPGYDTVTTLIVTGSSDGGTVCASDDDGQPHTLHRSATDGTPYVDTYTSTCTGTYKDGQLTYSSTTTSEKIVFSNGVSCVLRASFIGLRLEGTFTSATSISGSRSSDVGIFDCNQGDTIQIPSTTGTWTGTANMH